MTRNEIISLLAMDDFSDIYKKANEIKNEIYGNDVFVRGIIEFSNYCRADCAYCGINCNNDEIERFRMTSEEIISLANSAVEAGYKTIILQSGEDKYFTASRLGEIISEIKKNDVSVTISCGEMSFDDYAYLKKCGADRYLLKHETADSDIYHSLHTFSTHQNRIECLKNLKKLGFETGSGFMIGLPNQTLETIADDILLLKSIPCDMAGIGPFIPHPNTPLHNLPNGSTELTKRAVALTRIVLPKIHLPATTALGVINLNEKNDVFSCGANVIMKKVTPEKYKHLYAIYPSKITPTNIKEERLELERSIRALGRNPI